MLGVRAVKLSPEAFLQCTHCKRETAHLRQGVTSARILRAAILGLALPCLVVGICLVTAPGSEALSTSGGHGSPSRPIATFAMLASVVAVIWFVGWILLIYDGLLYCRQCGTRFGAEPPAPATPEGKPKTVAELEAASSALGSVGPTSKS